MNINPIGDIHDVTSLSHDGRGVAHVAGKTLFVSGALPGERVSIRKLRRRRSYDESEVDQVVLPSPQRVTPRCVHFGVCGGCSLQHLEPGAQLAAKQAHLIEELQRIGKVAPQELLPALSASAWNYRRRARLGARFVAPKGRVVVGFRERSAPLVADLQRCEILTQPLDQLIRPLADLLTNLTIRSRVPQIEFAAADNASAMVFRVLEPPSPDDLEQLRVFGERHAIQIHLQPGGIDSVVSIADYEPLLYRLEEFAVEIEFRPTDFIQINGELNRDMVAHAITLLDPGPADTVLDLYCGLGNFTLPLARRCMRVVGVDGDTVLLDRARGNAGRNGIGNLRFHRADLDLVDDKASWAMQRYDGVLLDPPRAGAYAVLPQLGRSGAGRVVYISCHPGSLARDAGILVHELGFTLRAVGVIDMFPHTSHVESVAVFGR